MKMLSEDDRSLRHMNHEELAKAWDLWFELAQTTNDADAPYSHGVFARLRRDPSGAGKDGTTAHLAPPFSRTR